MDLGKKLQGQSSAHRMFKSTKTGSDSAKKKNRNTKGA